jgi:hypothetical protein
MNNNQICQLSRINNDIRPYDTSTHFCNSPISENGFNESLCAECANFYQIYINIDGYVGLYNAYDNWLNQGQPNIYECLKRRYEDEKLKAINEYEDEKLKAIKNYDDKLGKLFNMVAGG